MSDRVADQQRKAMKWAVAVGSVVGVGFALVFVVRASPNFLTTVAFFAGLGLVGAVALFAIIRIKLEIAAANSDVEGSVLAAINAVQSGDSDRIKAAYVELAPIEAAEVLSELFLWVEDLTEGVDVLTLLSKARLPLPDEPLAIINAVRVRDMELLARAVGSGKPVRIFATLLVLVASLKDARERM